MSAVINPVVVNVSHLQRSLVQQAAVQAGRVVPQAGRADGGGALLRPPHPLQARHRQGDPRRRQEDSRGVGRGDELDSLNQIWTIFVSAKDLFFLKTS